MEGTKRKPSRYQLKKQAVFDALYKCCETNDREQVSLISVLRYISKEIDAKFKNSEHIVSDLKQKLSDKSQDGWLHFADTCEVFSNWMDIISCKPLSNASKTCRAIECTSHKLKTRHSLSSSSQPMQKSGIHENNISGTSSKCEKCDRAENCCEWRSNAMSREEKITQSYKQKLAELQKLLSQSEDCNSAIQMENESLRQNYAILQNKEQRWFEKEEELQKRELQVTAANTLLKEKNVATEKEMQLLKQQISCLKSENEKILSQNFFLEERVVEMSRMENLLSDARLQQSQMQMDIELKDSFLADLGLKLENLQQYNEVLEKQIKEIENTRMPDSNYQDLHEQSIEEELMAADRSNDIPCESNNIEPSHVPGESSLKAELDACWEQWPRSYEHVAMQATPFISTSSTQTDEDLLEPGEEKLNTLICCSKQYRNCQSVLPQPIARISTEPNAAAQISEEFSLLHLNDVLETAPIQQNAMTQTESVEERQKEQIVVKVPNDCELVPLRERSPANSSTLMFFVEKCPALHCIATSRNRICYTSPSSAVVKKSVCWKTSENTVAEQERKTVLQRFQYRVIQVLIVIMIWYLFQAFIQLHDGFMWCNLSSFWTKLHRILSPKIKLHWPNGPPPQ